MTPSRNLHPVGEGESRTAAPNEAERESETRLNLALVSARTALWQGEVGSQGVSWRARGYNLLGLRAGEGRLPGEQFFRHVHPQDAQALQARLSALMETGADWTDEFRIVSPDGEARWLAASGRLFRDAAGNPQSMSVVSHDITERWEREKALREAERCKDEFLATLAHELRNPLAPLQTGIELLKLRGSDQILVAQTAERLARQIEHMRRLVDDLLDISRIACGALELRKERVELAEVIRSAVELSPASQRRQYHVRIAPERLVVEGDPVRLVQVVSNLLNNALKFTEEDGHIWLEVARDGDVARISVRDDGAGIPPRRLSDVFEIFEQAGRSRCGGLGVGLAVVRRIVQKHGGSVEARSQGVGQGAELVVRLPLVVESRA